MELDHALTLAATWLSQSRRILFITGAGVSADSGLPTYRGVGGLYQGRATADGMRIEEALSGSTFLRHPELTWKYLIQIEQSCRGARPNQAHRAIAELESRGPSVIVLTQNVDGLHRHAGSRNVIEIHGNLHDLHCTACRYQVAVADYSAIDALPPSCPHCGEVVRPRVVLFEEALPIHAVERLYAEQASGFDTIVAIGTTGSFPYVVEPILNARRSGARTIEINPIRTRISGIADLHLPLKAAEAMDSIMQRLSAASGGAAG